MKFLRAIQLQTRCGDNYNLSFIQIVTYIYKMVNLFELIKTHIIATITITIGVLGLIISLWRLILYIKKTRLDITDSNNKRSKFSIFHEDSYRLNVDSENIYILFNVRITNHSLLKNTLNAFVEINYSDMRLKIKHNSELFNEVPHKQLTRLASNIKVEENEIKSGWLIFKYPLNLKNKLIDYFVIKVEDGNGKKAEVKSFLIKDVLYEDKKNCS